MRTLISIAVAVLLIAGACASAFADGGQVRAMQTNGDLQLTVFTSPTPLRAGPIDVSVLLQDAHSGQTIADADITVELVPQQTSRPPIRARATTDAATNKLLRAALVELPAPGEWKFRVECNVPHDDTLIATMFTAAAAEPLPRWLTVWPWFTWPVAAVALFAVHRTFVARRNHQA